MAVARKRFSTEFDEERFQENPVRSGVRNAIDVPLTLPTRRRTALDVVRDVQSYDRQLREYDAYGREARGEMALNQGVGSLLGMILSAGINSRGGTNPAIQSMMPGLAGIQTVAKMNQQADQQAIAEREKNVSIMAQAMMKDLSLDQEQRKLDSTRQDKALDREAGIEKAKIAAGAKATGTVKKIMEYTGEDGKKRAVMSDGTVVTSEGPVKDPQGGVNTRAKKETEETALKELDKVRSRKAELDQYLVRLQDSAEDDPNGEKAIALVTQDPKFKNLSKAGKDKLIEAVKNEIEEQYKSMNQWQRHAGWDATPSYYTNKTYDNKPRAAGKSGFSGKIGSGLKK